MNLNGSAVLVKKRAMDAELKASLAELVGRTGKALEDRERRLGKNPRLVEEVTAIKKRSIESLEKIVFGVSKRIRSDNLAVFVAKKPVDVAEYIRGIVGEEKIAMVPSPQTMEAEVMQAFFMSNKVDVVSDRYSGQEGELPSLHPYLPYLQTGGRNGGSDAKHCVISAVVLTENGNAYFEREEMEVLKKFETVFTIVTADRIFSELDADKIAHLIDISSGGFIRSEKTDIRGHLIILDNGRLALARSGLKDILMCINCYSCSLYCPVFLSVGGLFGSPTMAGIGALSASYQSGIKTGVNRGLYYCTLCGKCEFECPTKVPIIKLIEKMRKRAQISGF